MPEDVMGSSSDPQANEPGSVTGEPDGSLEAEGRSIDNLRGELLRKQDKAVTQLQEQIAMLNDGFQKMAQAFQSANAQRQTQSQVPPPPAEPVTKYGSPNPPVERYTDEQLHVALQSGRLTPHQAKEVERLLEERRVEAKTKELFEQRDKQQQFSADRTKADAEALAAFPALRDPQSEFSQKVNAELEARRAAYGETPFDKADAASRVARQMGIDATRVVSQGYVGSSEAGEPALVAEPEGPPDEELQQIARNLRYALPIKQNPKTGKMERKEFNMKRVKQRAVRYAKTREQGLGGHKIKGS
jgi:hypothetical protein